jgi:hypothetical protein
MSKVDPKWEAAIRKLAENKTDMRFLTCDNPTPTVVKTGDRLSIKKVTILSLLFVLGVVPLLLGDTFKHFVAAYMGVAMLYPFIYAAMVLVFWFWADFSIFEEQK